MTFYDNRKILNRKIRDDMIKAQNYLECKIFDTKIRENIALAEAPYSGMPVIAYDKNSNGATDYMNLAKEVISLEVKNG